METFSTYPASAPTIHFQDKDECKIYDLCMLAEMGDDDFSIEILNIFLQETPIELAKLHTAAIHKSNQVMQAIAHKLKSGTQFLKIDQLTRLLETIESEGGESCEGDRLMEKVTEAMAVYATLVNPFFEEIQRLKNNRQGKL